MDALRDLDDSLTLVHLFATLPAEAAHNIPSKAVATSRRLALEWQAWVVRTSALRRTFVSVKGFYFQADVMGQPVTWLVPHATSQVCCVLPLPLHHLSLPRHHCWVVICCGHAPDASLRGGCRYSASALTFHILAIMAIFHVIAVNTPEEAHGKRNWHCFHGCRACSFLLQGRWIFR